MAKFIYKIEGKEVAPENLPPGPLTQSFQNLKASLEKQIPAETCAAHGNELLVVLQNDGTTVRIAGFGGCCRDFVEKMVQQIKLPKDFKTTDWIFTERSYSYLHR